MLRCLVAAVAVGGPAPCPPVGIKPSIRLTNTSDIRLEATTRRCNSATRFGNLDDTPLTPDRLWALHAIRMGSAVAGGSMDSQTHAGVHSGAWARAVAMVQRRQAELEKRRAELQERAKRAERDLAFARIWGDVASYRRVSPPSKRLTTLAS
jgi:hypothetical protein